ncbi:mitogen-activated protein kinase kinase kinase 1-like [Cynara cardunculus var. scolymus]|uniref:mitogen-activated protein kinase kinase kinase n=1 Tax=Cynara cardunculus var. scolymus TaxID=59895 RepID=A0A103Y3F0_CYNCS|nr:mitogen-activated protein kinase kinase kinase 1-like [Cynara cardunculus var. scolymus]XP_024959756.1 mitogen-activated protein kinase kinase kinase 1-like [Cynara cardunculus var. scolymus]XP_024959757.1 mitogen-activated protein kinase kinase kinase 1-like [Cynara cardunculus var. scolymus]XP_024959758.1 mitogen-activated protein kinase kinase kinase 1-like [Cynara cardunculus var. scolymus]XP_024959759.1 mitogen-activated protein kinase kinase kinase 1-like [Cynara cardunculus var. scoly
MYTKQKRLGRRLERINAFKNADYDASTSSSSSSSSLSLFDMPSAHGTQSRDASLFSDVINYRIEGTEGEFDLICRSLGLSGPEDFAIPAADWEAHKACSPTNSNYLIGSRFRCFTPDPTKESPGSDFPETSESPARVSNDEVKRDTGCLRLTKDEEARVLVSNGGEMRGGDVRVFGIGEIKRVNQLSEFINGDKLADVEKSRGLHYGDDTRKAPEKGYVESKSIIKGVRPPLLARPPARSQVIVDNHASTWDLIRGFSPRTDEESTSVEPVRVISSLIEDAVAIVGPTVVEDGERSGTMTRTIVPQSILDTSDDEDNAYSMAATGLEYFVSPNGSIRCNIKNWQKGDFLGSGSFGTVYEGFNEYGFFFAVKEVSLLDQGSQGKQSILQLEQEILLLSQIQHDNIVRYLGTDKDDGKLYIFLELMPKGSLANLYQKYHLRDSQVSTYTRQILSGLNYLHDRNVVHRDIKCANILVDVSGSVKLADFGLAKATKLNDIKSCKGTPYWMAPEVVNNRKNKGYGLAADIWSLGCTVLEMLTRKVPYSHLEGMQALFRIGRGEPPCIPKTLSGDARSFILKCLQVNPNDRPTAAQLLEHPFVKTPVSMNLSPVSPLCSGVRSQIPMSPQR